MNKFDLVSGNLSEHIPWVEPPVFRGSSVKWRLDLGDSKRHVNYFRHTSSTLDDFPLINGKVLPGLMTEIDSLGLCYDFGMRHMKLASPDGSITYIKGFDLVEIDLHYMKRMQIRVRSGDVDASPTAMTLIRSLMELPRDVKINALAPGKNTRRICGVGLNDGCITLVSGIYVPIDHIQRSGQA